ncbi:hypothetical protein M5689_012993 [Euphorbia peplus]|nr:hypothetical protein M5689_012993 [Euphorbia peplus]
MKPKARTNPLKASVLRNRSSGIKINEGSLNEIMSRNEKMKDLIENSINQNSKYEVILRSMNKVRKPLYRNVCSRVILQSSHVYLGFIDSLKLHLRVWFRSQDWLNVLGQKDTVFPSLVHDFYKTLTKVSPGNFHASVKGTKIKLNAVILGEILQIPSQGKQI